MENKERKIKINIEPYVEWTIFSEFFLITAYTDEKIYLKRDNEEKISIISRNILNKDEELLNEILEDASEKNQNPINLKEVFPEYFL